MRIPNLEGLEHVVEPLLDCTRDNEAVDKGWFGLTDAMNAADCLIFSRQIHDRLHQDNMVCLDQIQPAEKGLKNMFYAKAVRTEPLKTIKI